MHSLLDIFMNKGKRIDGTTFIKEYEDSSSLVKSMEDIAGQIKVVSVREEIDQDITFIKAGDFGERNVYFELKNSFIPMLVLHNVVIQYDEYKAQLDFVLITNKFICLLETKKLNGHITINADSDFIRSLVNRQGKIYKREGMYSPVSQNQRHVRILENLLRQEKVIRKTPVLSLVVMANPKSLIDYQSAKKEIKQQIVKYDQLVPCIKRMMDTWKEVDLTPANMMGIADFLMDHQIEEENTFLTKYKKYLITEGMSIEAEIPIARTFSVTSSTPVSNNTIVSGTTPVSSSSPISSTTSSANTFPVLAVNTHVAATEPIPEMGSTASPISEGQCIDKEKLRAALSKFRLEQCRAENIKAFYIFNNAQMDCLLERMPKSSDDLMVCEGFGSVKTQKYGQQILKILNMDNRY